MAYDLSRGGFISPRDMILSFEGSGQIKGIGENGVPSAILLGYSGGADSSCLLHFLLTWCIENNARLYAAHINHGIRGDEALRDRDHCISQCKKLGIELFVLDADVPKIALECGKSLESAARDVRYEFFEKIMAEKSIPVLATAHNADDNLETLLFRLARGSGARGICGIPPIREACGGLVIRPMLSLTKDAVLRICREKGIEYVNDSTNKDTIYSRNSIRASALPILKSINPEASEAALRCCASLREDLAFIDSLAKSYMAEDGFSSVKKLALAYRPIFKRVVLEMYEKHSSAMLEATHFAAIERLVQAGRENSYASLPGGIRAAIRGEMLCFEKDNREKKKANADIIPQTELKEGENPLQGGYLLTVKKDFSTSPSQTTLQIHRSEENIYKLFTQVSLQNDKIKGSLFARGRLAGDKICFGGMSKDVRKLFSEKGVPQNERHFFPVICDEDGILWVPGIALRDGTTKKKRLNL